MSDNQSKWHVHKWRCRFGCCPVAWMATPPDGHEVYEMSLEFPTWAQAMRFVNEQAGL